MIRRGVLWAAYHALTWSHKLEDIEYTLACYDETLAEFKKIVDKNDKIKHHLEGPPVEPVFRKVADFMSYTMKDKKVN
jgi:glutamate-1-semialdehyde 2,1-aminomutase/spore coat polysaccharide biosynthesis protein SpsF